MLFQLQAIDPSGRHEFVAQSEDDPSDWTSIPAWIKDVQSRHDLPTGWSWHVCNENDAKFVWSAA